jgi:prepilin-type N-terminal cleavage/methylation domain-containing protein
MKTKTGFTLIELLVVVAIIGILSTVVLASLNDARAKGRDTVRITASDQLQKALELYYDDKGQYPPYHVNTSSATCGFGSSGDDWCTLEIALAPYLSPPFRDPFGDQDTYRYYYDSDSGDGYQTYGMMFRFEKDDRGQYDGGFYATEDPDTGNPACCFYEIGQQPQYCMATAYAPNDKNWWALLNTTTVCRGGN